MFNNVASQQTLVARAGGPGLHRPVHGGDHYERGRLNGKVAGGFTRNTMRQSAGLQNLRRSYPFRKHRGNIGSLSQAILPPFASHLPSGTVSFTLLSTAG